MQKPPATLVSLLMLATALVLGAESAHAGDDGAGDRTAKAASKKKTARHRKARRHGTTVPAAETRKTVEKSAALSPFGADQAAVRKAFTEDRHQQVVDAERAARAPDQPDRWKTVLYAIRDLDLQSSTEVCFWRALAYYRLGELGRARRTRQKCELPAPDAVALDREDIAATSLQPPSALPELQMAGDDDTARPRTVKPVVNPNPYTGPSPTPHH